MVIGFVCVGSSKNILFLVVNVRTGDGSGDVTEDVIFFVLIFLSLLPFFGAMVLIYFCLAVFCDTAQSA
jgi:hypothetical protein